MIGKILSHFPRLYKIFNRLCDSYDIYRHNQNDADVLNKSPRLKVIRDFYGENNNIKIEENCTGCISIRIRGRNNTITIGSNCYFGSGCSLWIEGKDSSISIGRNTTMTHSNHLNCQEASRKIEVGDDCMISNNVIIRTSDSHPIYDENGNRVNSPMDIHIGKHV